MTHKSNIRVCQGSIYHSVLDRIWEIKPCVREVDREDIVRGYIGGKRGGDGALTRGH